MEALDELRDPAASNAGRLGEQGLTGRAFSPAGLAAELARADVAIDAIFGTGFRGMPEDEWAAAIEGLNAACGAGDRRRHPVRRRRLDGRGRR